MVLDIMVLLLFIASMVFIAVYTRKKANTADDFLLAGKKGVNGWMSAFSYGTTYFSAKVAELFISGVFHGCQKWTQLRKAVDVAVASQTATDNREQLQKYIDAGLMTEQDFDDAKETLRHLKYERYEDTYGAADHSALYQGPLELLISRRTYSAAEDFTAMFKSNRRGTLIGEPTGGSSGTPYLFKLRCGGGGRIVSVGYRLLDGTEFIGRGIRPDVFVETDE